jgi:uncharacterized protein YqjF (DUF2071 family)
MHHFPAMNSDSARERLERDGGAIALTDWRSVIFLHFAVPPEILQPSVPFPLDLHGGMAYVSIVSFDQRSFRLPMGGPLAHVIHFIGSNLFCNVRTYVQVGEEPGIFFLTEWVPNPLGAVAAPIYPGLRYRLARLQYEMEGRTVRRTVFAQQGQMTLEAEIPRPRSCSRSEPGSVAHFCLERYTAFARSPFGDTRFHIWHHPWDQTETQAALTDDRLLARFPWYPSAEPAGAQYSPGITGVRIALPRLLER